ncbi:MAG: sigma-54 interaction domain-containing protein [Anaerovoracaceae bacterium]
MFNYKEELLDLILHSTTEPVVVIDKDGKIIEMSAAYLNFLKIKKENAIGRDVEEVIENSRMKEVIKTGKAEIAEPHKIKGKTMIATRIPIIKDGVIVGAFGRVLFKNVKELDSLYGRLNKAEQELSDYKNRYGNINTAKYGIKDIVGQADSIVELKENILRFAPANSNILLTGESGTGKELVAHAIHAESKRKNKALICVNCGAIPPELVESEFFGYEEGAFTGSQKGGKDGLFQSANGGTLMLDEIGDLPLKMQVKLLRAIQEKEVRRIGANKTTVADVRIIAVTNKNLMEMSDKGLFRQDLYYRLNVLSLSVPPLRERKEDIPLLGKHFVDKIKKQEGIPVKDISDKAMKALIAYDWPGNIREFENTIERASNFIGENGIIEREDLTQRISGIKETRQEEKRSNYNYKEYMRRAEKELINDCILLCKGNRSKAAKMLGISRTSLYEKLGK